MITHAAVQWLWFLIIMRHALPWGIKVFKCRPCIASATQPPPPHRRAMAAASKRVHFIDCPASLLRTPAGNINGTLMPDATVPSPAGYGETGGPSLGLQCT